MSDRLLVHRLAAPVLPLVGSIGPAKVHPWRTCGGRLNRDGKLEHCPFVVAPDYEHRFATVDERGAEEKPCLPES